MRLILFLFLMLLGSCMQQSKRTASDTHDPDAGKDTIHHQIAVDTASLQLTNHTVEDTVRHQIGGKLYHNAGLNPADSITVIKTFYAQIPEDNREYFNVTQYREYHFIVHNRHSNAHSYFEIPVLDKVYANSNFNGSEQNQPVSGYIDPVIKDFNGYWVYLEKYNGNYYLDDDWSLQHRSFCISDSIFTYLYQDGPNPRKIEEAVSLPGILFDGHHTKIEVVDQEKLVYRYHGHFNDSVFIAPVRAIHNFEVIQHTNNTGDLM